MEEKDNHNASSSPLTSIAVSAVVRPSVFLFALETFMFLGIALVGICVGFGLTGNLSFLSKLGIAGACILISCFGFYSSRLTRKSLHIDISGIGQIRIAEHNELTVPTLQDNSRKFQQSGQLVKLMPGSTVWPNLLLLHLQAKDRQRWILPVLPDCVNAESFRALSVAVRWIAAHNGSDEYKIL